MVELGIKYRKCRWKGEAAKGETGEYRRQGQKIKAIEKQNRIIHGKRVNSRMEEKYN